MANYIVQEESLEIVADSIRAKAGVGEKLEFPYGWKAAVDGIHTGGGSSHRNVNKLPDWSGMTASAKNVT